MHQSFVSPPGINPVSQTPQPQIDVHSQLCGVVVSGSATSFSFLVPASIISCDDSSLPCWANGQAPRGMSFLEKEKQI